MITLQKFEVKKMVTVNSIESVIVIYSNDGYVITFSARGSASGIKLVTQKGNIKSFKTLDSVRGFLCDVGILSFTVC